MSKARRNIAPSKKPCPFGQDELTVILLAAKMGRRMKSKGPKSLFELNYNLKIIDNQIQAIWSQHTQADIIIVADFQYEKIRNYVRGKYPVRVILSPDHEEYGMMHGVGVGIQACISKNILIMYGDLVLEQNILNLSQHSASEPHGSSIIYLTNHSNKCDDEIGAVIGDDQYITNLAYGLPYRWCQIAYFTGREREILEKLAFSPRTYNWMFHEGINDIISKGGNFISHILSPSSIVDIDCWEDLERIRTSYE